MQRLSLIATGLVAAALTGCVSYPVYQPAPVARLTPSQSAALAGQPLSQADRDRYAAADAQVQREDQAAQTAQSYSYGYPVAPAVPVYPAYSYGYYGYPSAYYGGFYPYAPLSLSLGFGFGGGYRGGYHGGHRGGYHSGFRGRR